jgi:hypothetical protein
MQLRDLLLSYILKVEINLKIPIPMMVILIFLLTSCDPRPAAQMEPAATQEIPPTTTPTDFPHDPPAGCAVTQPQISAFVPPAPYSPNAPSVDEFWYGTDSLWTTLPASGIWWALPHNAEGYTQKIFWWRKGYSTEAEPQPNLSLTGERLGTSPLTFTRTGATNARAEDIGEAMLMGVDIPSLGCWKITGKYAKAELSFVIWVAP